MVPQQKPHSKEVLQSRLLILGVLLASVIFFSSEASPVAHITGALLLLGFLIGHFRHLQNLRNLAEIEGQQTALFQNIKEGLVILNPEGQITGHNPAACEILGRDLEDLREMIFLGKYFSEKGTPLQDDENPVQRTLQQHETVQDFVMGFIRDDGARVWLKVNASPFRASPHDISPSTLITFSNITELKKNQQIILEQQMRLEANSKMVAMGEIAAGIAHEINNPLAIITGKVFLIQKSLKTERFAEPLEKSLDKIKSTVDRIRTIVRGLQTFSMGGDQDPFQMVPLKAVIEDAVAFCANKIERLNIQIINDVEEDLTLECRPVQISQVLVNLISNACDAVESQAQRRIRIWARSAHNTAVLKVSDSGPGIPPEVQQKLMQPFFTTKEVGKGTGLGLSISRGLIRSHLGKLWLDSKAAETTFIIEIPLLQEATQKAS